MKKSSHVKRSNLLSRIESSEISIGEIRIKKVKDPELPQKKAKDQIPEATYECGCKTSISSCCKPDCVYIDKTGGKSRSRKPTADMKGDYSDETSDHDEQKLKKVKTKEEPERQAICKPYPETGEERDSPAVGRGNVGRKKQSIAKKDTRKLRPKLSEVRDVGVNKTNVDRTERLPEMQDSSVACECNNIELNHPEVETFVLFNAENNRGNFENAKETEYDAHTRKTMSSVQIRYASVAYMKQLAYSSTDVGAMSDSSCGHLNSFQTLFRERRKSATPNLGTSAYSLYSEDGNNSENKCAKLKPQDSKPKKPFLRRLMSCLVMRSNGDSELKLPVGPPPPNLLSVNSSIDSYHISTSLAAVEVSSSIYDTSASFYSNHSINPINSKIKRGFFSSVRGFLTNRKS